MNLRNSPQATRLFCLTILALISSLKIAFAQNPATIAGPIVNPANGHQFYLLEPASWTNSEAAALALGGDLVTIDDAEENSWVYQTFAAFGGVNRDLWIGLYNPNPQSSSSNIWSWLSDFEWISGQNSSFRLWAFTESTTNSSIRAGFVKLNGPDASLAEQGFWAEALESTPLSGVVEVSGSLEILTQPQNTSVHIGETATFTVSADGTPPIYYQWQFGGTNLLGETSSRLRLSNVQLSQSGPYSVVVSNSTAVLASEPAKLGVSGVVTWDVNFNGMVPTPAEIGTTRAIAVGCGFNVALREDGTVVSWGDISSGELIVMSGLTNIVAIAAGCVNAFALKPDGTIFPWGSDRFGAIDVPSFVTNATAVSAGNEHSLALLADHRVVAWGLGSSGGIEATNAVAISAGMAHNLVLGADGTVSAWSTRGGDTYGETIVPAGLQDVVAISAGAFHSMALKADGTVVAWGDDMSGEIDVPAGLSNVVAISAGSGNELALKADGTLVTWGVGISQLPPLANVKAIAAGWNQNLALLGDGSPTLTVEPWDQWVPRHVTLNLDSKTLGAQPMTFQWSFNGQEIPGATRDRYSIASADITNSGTYSIAVSNRLGVTTSRQAIVVVDPNLPIPTKCIPVLAPQSDLVIDELTELVVTNTASICGGLESQLVYKLGAPTGASIDSSGVIRWTPSEVQGPGTNVFITLVINYGVPQTSATNSFKVTVKEVNSPPMLRPQAFQLACIGRAMTVINTAIDSDVPKQTLTYQLINAPAGASIDQNGVVVWTPTEAQAPGTNVIITVVTDNGIPPLTAQNQFTVTVLNTTNGVPVGILANRINPANGHQYYLLEPATWTNAELAAVALGGHLVTINNPDENRWVYETFGSYGGVSHDLWIGLYDIDPSIRLGTPEMQMARYRWISGQSVPVTPDMWVISDQPYNTGYRDSGYFKICGPNDTRAHYAGFWTDDYESTLLNGVAEVFPTLDIATQPTRTTVGIGAKATLSVVAEGPGPIYYQWQYAGTNLPGETNSALTLTNLQPAQSGLYSVTVHNSDSSVASHPAMLLVAGIVGWGCASGADARANIPDGLFTGIAAGWYHDLAIRPDGTVAAWGDDSRYQLNVPPDLTNVVAISAGSYHSLALKSDGTVVAWGDSPGEPQFALTNVIAIDATAGHNLALTAEGTIVSWGYGCGGPLAPVPAGLTNVVAIAADQCHDLALKADGTVVDWDCTSGQIIPVPSTISNVVAISAGQTANLALRADGTVAAWATRNYDWFLALNVPVGLSNVVAISAKTVHSLALLANGTVVAWGTNWCGESGVTPGLPNVIAIAGGLQHSIALLRDGAPSLTVQPWDQQVTNGASPTFVAKAAGMNSLSYQWKFNGNTIPGATRDALGVSNAQAADAGLYTLSVSNEVGVSVSRHAKLVVGGISSLNTNRALVLPAIADCEVDELTQLVVTNTAADPDNPASLLGYLLVNPPPGAGVDANGLIRWTPSEAQGPGSFFITTIATRQGDPNLSATNSFLVTVKEVNRSPVLPAQTDLTIAALSSLALFNAASDPDIPANTLSYELSSAPEGATVDSTGLIRWTPRRTQGPSINRFTIVVRDDGAPPLSATNSFEVVVTAPVLMPVPDLAVNPGQQISFTNVAIDNDIARHLTFSLGSAPKEAAITADSGVFSWRCPVHQAGSSNYVQIRVTDDGAIPLTDSLSFSIRVNPLQPTRLEPISLSDGVFHLRVTDGCIGPDYILQASANPLEWTDLQSNTPTSMPFEFADTNLLAFTNRLYRVRLAP